MRDHALALTPCKAASRRAAQRFHVIGLCDERSWCGAANVARNGVTTVQSEYLRPTENDLKDEAGAHVGKQEAGEACECEAQGAAATPSPKYSSREQYAEE